jgi:hypothetical protein
MANDQHHPSGDSRRAVTLRTSSAVIRRRRRVTIPIGAMASLSSLVPLAPLAPMTPLASMTPLVAPAGTTRMGLPQTTPRIVVERLRPFFLADPDFATSLRLQLDAVRAEIFPRTSSHAVSRPTPR